MFHWCLHKKKLYSLLVNASIDVFILLFSGDDKSNTWNDSTITATVFAVVFGLAFTGLVTYLCYKKRKRDKQGEDQPNTIPML